SMEAADMTGNNRPDLAPVTVPVPALWPATLSAVIVTAAAGGFLALTARSMGATFRTAVAAGLVAGLGTTAWAVAANMSWTHGPAMLAIAAGVYAASRKRWLLSGLAFGAGVLVRPHIAVIAAALGIGAVLRDRRLEPISKVALGSGAGLVALLAYNYWLWNTWTISGGYGSH